jgi:hypothetical protein
VVAKQAQPAQAAPQGTGHRAAAPGTHPIFAAPLAAMADNSEMRSAVLKALASDFRGLTLKQIGNHVGQQLDSTIHLKNLRTTSVIPCYRQ